jgi:uncharacterized membrane protein YdjX (TVP38/TMEM64 family)
VSGAAARRRAALLRLAMLAAGLAAAGLVLREIGLTPEAGWLEHRVRGRGLDGRLAFVAIGAAVTAAGLPRQGVAFLAGFAFGAFEGTLLALAAQLAGCALAYGWARLVGRAWAERRLAGRFGHRLRPLRDALAGSPFGATLALRLLPVGNNLALNLLAGMAAIPPVPFLTASALGYLPQTAVFALLGKGVRVDGGWQLALAVALFAVSAAIGFALLRRHRAARALEADANGG